MEEELKAKLEGLKATLAAGSQNRQTTVEIRRELKMSVTHTNLHLKRRLEPLPEVSDVDS